MEAQEWTDLVELNLAYLRGETPYACYSGFSTSHDQSQMYEQLVRLNRLGLLTLDVQSLYLLETRPRAAALGAEHQRRPFIKLLIPTTGQVFSESGLTHFQRRLQDDDRLITAVHDERQGIWTNQGTENVLTERFRTWPAGVLQKPPFQYHNVASNTLERSRLVRVKDVFGMGADSPAIREAQPQCLIIISASWTERVDIADSIFRAAVESSKRTLVFTPPQG